MRSSARRYTSGSGALSRGQLKNCSTPTRMPVLAQLQARLSARRVRRCGTSDLRSPFGSLRARVRGLAGELGVDQRDEIVGLDELVRAVERGVLGEHLVRLELLEGAALLDPGVDQR